MGFPSGSDSKESTCNVGDLGLVPGSGRSPGEGMATHSSILAWRIPMDRGAWWATVHGVTKSWTRLSMYACRYAIRNVFSYVCAELCLVTQLCPTLCDPMGCSPPGSSVHGIFQARILEWVVTPHSRGSSQPRGQTPVSCISSIGRWILYHYATWEPPPTH